MVIVAFLGLIVLNGTIESKCRKMVHDQQILDVGLSDT